METKCIKWNMYECIVYASYAKKQVLLFYIMSKCVVLVKILDSCTLVYILKHACVVLFVLKLCPGNASRHESSGRRDASKYS